MPTSQNFYLTPNRQVKKYCRRHSTCKHFKHRMNKTCAHTLNPRVSGKQMI